MNYGNFSDITFEASKNLNRLLFEQGELITDAKLNETRSIVAFELQQVAKGIFPWHGTNEASIKYEGVTGQRTCNWETVAFKPTLPTAPETEITLGEGVYFADGRKFFSNGQSNLLVGDLKVFADQSFVIYLNGWYECSEESPISQTTHWRVSISGLPAIPPADDDNGNALNDDDRIEEGVHRWQVDRKKLLRDSQLNVFDVELRPSLEETSDRVSASNFKIKNPPPNSLGRLEVQVAMGVNDAGASSNREEKWLKWSRTNRPRLVAGTLAPSVGTSTTQNLSLAKGELKPGEILEEVLPGRPPHERGDIYEVIGNDAAAGYQVKRKAFKGPLSSQLFQSSEIQTSGQIKFRVWDQTLKIANGNVIELNALRLKITDLANASTGDYWLIKIRDSECSIGLGVANGSAQQPATFTAQRHQQALAPLFIGVKEPNTDLKLFDTRIKSIQPKKPTEFAQEFIERVESLLAPTTTAPAAGAVQPAAGAISSGPGVATEPASEAPAGDDAEPSTPNAEATGSTDSSGMSSPNRNSVRFASVQPQESARSLDSYFTMDSSQLAKTIPIASNCQPLKQWLASATVGAIRKEPSLHSLTAKICRTVDVADHELPDFERELAAIHEYVHSNQNEEAELASVQQGESHDS